MNKTEQNIFFELIRAALWGHETDRRVFCGDYDWENIIRSFQQHALLGFVADTVLSMPEDLMPSAEQESSILKYVSQLMRTHFRLNKVVVDIFDLLENHGIKPVLLKGQGCATLYPIENTRSCGDIDIFVGRERYVEACRLIDEYCGEDPRDVFFDPNNIHWSSDKGDIHIETHYRLADTAIPGIKDEYNEWAERELLGGNVEYVRISDRNIRVPGRSFNSIYIFEHLLKHLRYEGVGFRQFIDWILVMKDAEVDGEILKHFHLLDAWQVLGGVLVCQLGYDSKHFPFWNEKKASHSQGRNLQYIIDSGNLGKYTAEAKGYYYMPKSIKRDWYAFMYYSRYLFFEYHLFPFDTKGKTIKRIWNKARGKC